MKYLYPLMFVMILCITADSKDFILSLSAVNIDPGYIINYDESSYNTNWYCAEQQESITASSTLKDSAKSTYSAGNIHDGKLETAWVEGKKDQGIGESVSISLTATSTKFENLTIAGFRIANGYVKDKNLYMLNSRVKSMTMYVDDKPFADIKLNDFYGFQQIEFQSIPLPVNKTVTIKFVITDVYPGSKYSDTSISEIWFFGGGIL